MSEERAAERSNGIKRGSEGQSTSLMTASEVAALLGVPATWVYEQARAGQIPTVPLGRYRRFRREAIEAWIERLEAAGEEAGAVA
jgi:excisionase family DNA binding protein